MRDKKPVDDGMQHYYSTCPVCGHIASDENIVRVDGVKICRTCLGEKIAAKLRKQGA